MKYSSPACSWNENVCAGAPSGVRASRKPPLPSSLNNAVTPLFDAAADYVDGGGGGRATGAGGGD